MSISVWNAIYCRLLVVLISDLPPPKEWNWILIVLTRDGQDNPHKSMKTIHSKLALYASYIAGDWCKFMKWTRNGLICCICLYLTISHTILVFGRCLLSVTTEATLHWFSQQSQLTSSPLSRYTPFESEIASSLYDWQDSTVLVAWVEGVYDFKHMSSKD